MIKLDRLKCKDNIAIYRVVYKDVEYLITIDCVSGDVISKSEDLSDRIACLVRNKLVRLYVERAGKLPRSTGIMTH